MTEDIMRLARARAMLNEKLPYFSSTLVSFSYAPTDAIPTMALSENLVCFYNPGFVAKLTDAQAAGGLVHELLHFLHRHFARKAPGMDHGRWNMAGDLAINPTVLQQGLELPTGALLPKNFGFEENLTLEQYYELLSKEEEKKKNDPKGGKSGDGKEPEKGMCSGRCGGVAGNGHPGLEDSAAAKEQGRHAVEVEHIARELRDKVRKAARSNARGTLWGVSADDVEADRSRVPWRQVLRHTMRRQTGIFVAGSTHHTMRKPARRSFMHNYPLPSLRDRKPEVAVAIDTSGSMSEERLRVALGEAVGVFRAAGVGMAWLLEADSRVAAPPKRVPLRALLKARLHGRGGTDFNPALEAVGRLRPRPNLLVYLTDGEGVATVRPDIPVIWGVVDGNTRWLEEQNWPIIVPITDD